MMMIMMIIIISVSREIRIHRSPRVCNRKVLLIENVIKNINNESRTPTGPAVDDDNIVKSVPYDFSVTCNLPSALNTMYIIHLLATTICVYNTITYLLYGEVLLFYCEPGTLLVFRVLVCDFSYCFFFVSFEQSVFE
jgi:hypothetical protein